MNILMNTVLPIVISFVLTVGFGPFCIKKLRELKAGQTEREDGPKSHLSKAGTPTMGGIFFLLAMVITSLVYCFKNTQIIPVLFVTLAFGLIGFLDDYIKVVMKRSLGLKAWQKTVLQLIVAGVFCYYILGVLDKGTTMMIPFWEGHYIELGIFYVPVFLFIVVGTVNGANLTDGVDGLATSVTALIATFFTVSSIGIHAGLEPITGAVLGALGGFLVYNAYPAKVFMGDTGSLALGGFVVSVAFLMDMPLLLPFIAVIYVVEALSVILQVGSYKLFKKRIFRMSPIHHHFENGGWKETKVVLVFCIVTAIGCMVAYAGMW